MPRGMRGVGRAHLVEDGRPKARMTPYAFFVQTCRAEHRRKHPEDDVNFGEFSKKCADRWRTMSDKEKKRFNQMSDEDKKRYDLEMSNYAPHGVFSGVGGTGAGRNAKFTPEMLAHHHAQQQRAQMAQAAQMQLAAAAAAGEVGGKRRRKKKRVKDPNAPKRCMSAFFWFSQDERSSVKAANPSFAVGEIAKELARRWADLTPEQRIKYDKLAAEDRARYLKDKVSYADKLKHDQEMVLQNQEAELLLQSQEAELSDPEEEDEEEIAELLEEIESD